jgi:hypothetical protein
MFIYVTEGTNIFEQFFMDKVEQAKQWNQLKH